MHMFNKVEWIGIGVSVVAMATALFLLNLEPNEAATRTVANSNQTGAVYVANNEAAASDLKNAIIDAAGGNGDLDRMIINDITVGEGAEVKAGDTVTVHYIGTLQNGQEFDNSNKRGEPFTFTVGEGRVIKGWEEGLIGMKVGGQRILVIPPDMGYGAAGIGPIPGNAVLVFSIELLAIEE